MPKKSRLAGAGADSQARSVAWVWRRVVGRWGGMATVRTVAAGARSRAWAAWAAEWVITVSARESRARVSGMSPGRRSCGRTLWQMTAVRADRPRPAMIARYGGAWSGVR